jgi:Transcription factor WhiB
VDPEWWNDPESKADAPHPETLLACLLCERCPVRRKCLETALRPDTMFVPSLEALSRHQTWGVWAGTTHRERARALRTTESAEVAAEQLEAELPARLERRVRAWKTNVKSATTAGLIEPLLRSRKEAS